MLRRPHISLVIALVAWLQVALVPRFAWCDEGLVAGSAESACGCCVAALPASCCCGSQPDEPQEKEQPLDTCPCEAVPAPEPLPAPLPPFDPAPGVAGAALLGSIPGNWVARLRLGSRARPRIPCAVPRSGPALFVLFGVHRL